MKEVLQLARGCEGAAWFHRSVLYRTYASHHHEELELNLVVQGSARYLLGNRKYHLHAHDVAWLFPSQEHVLVEHSADYEMWILVFTPKLIRSAVGGGSVLLKSNPPGYFCKRIPRTDSLRLTSLMEDLSRIENDPARFNAGLQYALLSAWNLYEEAETQPDFMDIHPAIEKAARILRQENGMISLNDLARKSGLSSSRLSRLFKKRMGVPINKFRNQQRLEQFRKLYGMGDRRTMMDAALEAGFGSYPQFHRIFRELMGYGPAEYRRNLQK